jgi:hypothetical protein
VRNTLAGVALQVAGGVCPVAERLDGSHDIGLLRDDGFTKAPGPVEVLIQQVNDFRIVQERDDRVIPFLVRRQ